MDIEDILGWLSVIVVAVFLLYGGIFIAINSSTERRCLETGWRDAKVTWNLQRYCIARTDQSDIVKPLKWAEANPR